MGAMLSVKNLEVNYGTIRALKGISFEVNEGEIVSLIGANGAGKTTTLHAISRLIPNRGGEVVFMDKHIERMEPDKIVRLGLAQVPEGRRVFAQMTVLENLEMGAYTRNDTENLGKDMEKVIEHLPRLKERRRQYAGELSGGEQQMLAIGRALMSNPKMLLLDEPSMGLSPILVQEIFNIIQNVSKSGVSILLVEQNAKMALNIAERAYVLETGSIAMSGRASDLANDEKVKKAYLGG